MILAGGRGALYVLMTRSWTFVCFVDGEWCNSGEDNEHGLRTETQFVVSDPRICSSSLMPMWLTSTRAWMRMGERWKGVLYECNREWGWCLNGKKGERELVNSPIVFRLSIITIESGWRWGGWRVWWYTLLRQNPPSKLIPPFMHPGRAASSILSAVSCCFVFELAVDVRDRDSSVSIKNNKSLNSNGFFQHLDCFHY